MRLLMGTVMGLAFQKKKISHDSIVFLLITLFAAIIALALPFQIHSLLSTIYATGWAKSTACLTRIWTVKAVLTTPLWSTGLTSRLNIIAHSRRWIACWTGWVWRREKGSKRDRDGKEGCECGSAWRIGSVLVVCLLTLWRISRYSVVWTMLILYNIEQLILDNVHIHLLVDFFLCFPPSFSFYNRILTQIIMDHVLSYYFFFGRSSVLSNWCVYILWVYT